MPLPGFEPQTHPLSPYEKKVIAPLVQDCLEGCDSLEKAVTNHEVCDRLRRREINLSAARCRAVVNYLRTTGALKGLVACNRGYYLTDDPEVIIRYIRSLQGRVNEIERVKGTFEKYLHHLTTDITPLPKFDNGDRQ